VRLRLPEKVTLTQGQFAWVDGEDFDRITKHLWYFHKSGYAITNATVDGKKVKLRMHRVILDAPPGLLVDHIDGNKLNNLKSNLRLCTHQENQQNRSKYSNNTSGYKGVVKLNDCNRWIASIWHNGSRIHLGTFTSPELAHDAYKAAALKYHEEFAKF